LAVDCFPTDPRVTCECCDECIPGKATRDPASVAPPTTSAREESIQAALGGDFNPGTPQYAALQWIVNTDNQKLDANDPRLTQRYVLAFLYFSLQNLPSDWLSPSSNECSFPGITCDGGKVNTISLVANSLKGTLPSEISYIDSLVVLEMSDNALSGKIPTELGSMENLGKGKQLCAFWLWAF